MSNLNIMFQILLILSLIWGCSLKPIQEKDAVIFQVLDADSLYIGKAGLDTCAYIYNFKLSNTSHRDLLFYFDSKVTCFEVNEDAPYMAAFNLVPFDIKGKVMDYDLTPTGFMSEDEVNDPLFNPNIIVKYVRRVPVDSSVVFEMDIGSVLNSYNFQCYLLRPDELHSVSLFINHSDNQLRKFLFDGKYEELSKEGVKLFDGVIKLNIPVSHNCKNW